MGAHFLGNDKEDCSCLACGKVFFSSSLQPEIDLGLEMFFEPEPKLNAVSFRLLIAKNTEKRCREIIPLSELALTRL